MSYQPCDLEGEPLPGTELKEVNFLSFPISFQPTNNMQYE